VKKAMLIIMDGFGIAKNPEVSAIDKARTPYIDFLYNTYPHAQLEASGLAVGLPEGQMGNSEVGHMNLGAGRIIFQDIVKIDKSIKSGEFFELPRLLEAFDYAKENNKKVHLLGLVSNGGIHSHNRHLYALTELANRLDFDDLYVHAFMDGRDTDPKSGKAHLINLEEQMSKTKGKVASIIGRYYAMDRDKRWERIALAYNLLTKGVGREFTSSEEAIADSYIREVTDEFVEASVIMQQGQPIAVIEDGDVVIHFNFRSDRARQLTMALTQKDLPDAGMQKMNLKYLTMTNYDETFKGLEIIFDKPNLEQTLGEVIANAELAQIRIAETEKYPHVTYFFNGGREEPFANEQRILINSPKVATYDLQPEMSAYEVRDAIVREIEKESAELIVLNFANPDMVGHTGVMEAAIKAVETVDACVKNVIEAGLTHGYDTILLSDHGNSDCLINEDGTPNTAHTTQPVPWWFISKENSPQIEVKNGKLADVAPTILNLLSVEIPPIMDGEILVSVPERSTNL
jgi:2,3-bisphosphoglycerate-independent phosphoglycerate mutase